MGTIASLVTLVACIKLLNVTGSPRTATGVFVVGKVLIALLLGAGLLGGILSGGVAALIGFGYFWLLDRLDGSGVYWIALMIGVLLLI